MKNNGIKNNDTNLNNVKIQPTTKPLAHLFLIVIAAAILSAAALPLMASHFLMRTTPHIGFIRSIAPFGGTVQYGLIGENTVLLDNDLQPITGLPATYFVIIISEDDAHYSVQYSDLTGMIDKSKIVKIDYEPKTKFGSAYFTAGNDTHPVNIRSAPKAAANVVGTIPDGGGAFYYGAVSGDALIPAAGSMWYYVRTSDGQKGYVYSTQGIAGVLPVNSGERVETPEGDGGGGGGATSFPDWGFILLLAVPAVIITLALFSRKGGQREMRE
ncbi:MAG: SH3 domain-containing protein [Firmicutes bacterium]|nr:SH3 domain-containing protein [Bacillota bacterium]